jgi:hypothetical protein
MTRQRFCTTAEILYNCNLISQLQKKCTAAISFHNCILLRRNNRKNAQLLFHFTTAKKMYNCKTNAQQPKKCTTAKQIYCKTNSEALMGYSTWKIIILLLFSLAFILQLCKHCIHCIHYISYIAYIACKKESICLRLSEFLKTHQKREAGPKVCPTCSFTTTGFLLFANVFLAVTSHFSTYRHFLCCFVPPCWVSLSVLCARKFCLLKSPILDKKLIQIDSIIPLKFSFCAMPPPLDGWRWRWLWQALCWQFKRDYTGVI